MQTLTKKLIIVPLLAVLTVLAEAKSPDPQANAAPTAAVVQAKAAPAAIVLMEPQMDPAELERLLDSEGRNLEEIRALLMSRQYDHAITKAKQSLDLIRVRTGVDPKSQSTEPVRVQGLLAPEHLALSVSDLPYNMRLSLIQAVSRWKGGWYLDLINLAKRTYVMWVAAQYQRLKQTPQLFARDREKLIRDLARAHNYAILIQDSNAPSGPLMISDKEVANDDQSYYFDRELLELATSIPDLRLNEQAFDAHVQSDWNSRLASHRKAVAPQPSLDLKANFSACHQIYDETLHSHEASAICEVKAVQFQFINNPVFDRCFKVHDDTLLAHEAANSCVEKISKGTFRF